MSALLWEVCSYPGQGCLFARCCSIGVMGLTSATGFDSVRYKNFAAAERNLFGVKRAVEQSLFGCSQSESLQFRTGVA